MIPYLVKQAVRQYKRNNEAKRAITYIFGYEQNQKSTGKRLIDNTKGIRRQRER